jgi:hypothetical protein
MYNILHYFTCCFKGTFRGGIFKKKQENQPLVEDFEIQHIYLNPDVEL